MKRISVEEAKQYRVLDTNYIRRRGMHEVVAFTLTPISDEPGWEQVTYYGASWVDPTSIPQRPHYIYILVNPSVPGICKIGYTTTTVYDRVKQINSATGVITPWYPVFSYKCPNGRMLEQEVHEELALHGTRINDRREGFAIDTDSARAIIEKLGKKYKLNEENDEN
jgi:hypothetical protein